MSNKFYDRLKFIALVLLPALATFVIAIFEIWGLPYGAQVGATVTALSTFLGAILVTSSAKYNVEQKLNEKPVNKTMEDLIAESLKQKLEENRKLDK